jgi:hypothetical protein
VNVRNIEITKSPLSPDRTCVRADVICDDRTIPPEVYWIDVPCTHAGYLSESGNPWLSLLLSYAVHLREPLAISKPVDHELYVNAHELMRVWSCWYPKLKPVPIDAAIREQLADRARTATAALFSGGVDAWFTLLTHNGDPNAPDRFRIDDLLCVWGLDISLENAAGFRTLRDALVRATSGLGTELIDVATNLYDTRWWKSADWGRVAHGSALASIGHSLGGRYTRVLIPSTHRYDDPIPWGSHPLTDPLLSSSLTKIIHDGGGFSRVEKTEALTKSVAAMNSLQVCWETRSYRNCEACNKCYRTITTLFLLGALDRSPRFKTRRIDKRKLAKTLAEDESDLAFMREVLDLAVRTGHRDIARAIHSSFKRGRRIELGLKLTRRLLKLTTPKWRRRLDWRIERLLVNSPFKNAADTLPEGWVISNRREAKMQENDRRLRQRFDMRVQVKIRNLDSLDLTEQLVESSNISARGVYFSTDLPLHIGARVEMFLTMPVQIAGKDSRLRRCTGRVVRMQPRSAVQAKAGNGVEIHDYEVAR